MVLFLHGRKRAGQTDEHIDGQTDGRTERLTKRQTQGRTDRQTDRETGGRTQTDRQTHPSHQSDWRPRSKLKPNWKGLWRPPKLNDLWPPHLQTKPQPDSSTRPVRWMSKRAAVRRQGKVSQPKEETAVSNAQSVVKVIGGREKSEENEGLPLTTTATRLTTTTTTITKQQQ